MSHCTHSDRKSGSLFGILMSPLEDEGDVMSGL